MNTRSIVRIFKVNECLSSVHSVEIMHQLTVEKFPEGVFKQGLVLIDFWKGITASVFGLI